MKYLLTITIPTFNEEKDLPACLQSIVSQTLRKKVEVIIVDNESLDSTLKIAKSFKSRLNLKILSNKIKDAEVSKMLGFRKASGKYFMYLDADMRFSHANTIEKLLFPLERNKQIAGTFIKFLVNKRHPPLTRLLSYDEFQRDPIFRFFTLCINDVLLRKEKEYWLCSCSPGKVPPQGLMIYRKKLIKKYARTQNQLIDNEIPAVLAESGNNLFAFVPSTGVEHLLLRSLFELSRKRIRNLERTYYPNKEQRKFAWISWKKDWPKAGIWLLYTHSIFPFLFSWYKAFKYKDTCFLAEPALNLVSTYSIIWGVLKNL